MNAVATGIAYIVLWAALAFLLALIYWLWVVLVLDPLWMWQERRRKVAEAAEKHERAMSEIDRECNRVVQRLVERYDATREEIRRQERQR